MKRAWRIGVRVRVEPMLEPPNTLRRALGLPLLTLYGLGTVLGAGIYVLIGEVAGRAGLYAPLSFVLAAVISSLTAFSFAEMASRFPKSAGEAVYVLEGFGRKELSLLVGLMVGAAGIISAAAIAQGFAGYFESFVAVPHGPTVAVLIVALTVLACWGIAESVMVAAIITLVEASALIVVIALGLGPAVTTPVVQDAGALPAFSAIAILSGAVLAFYAYIGFEDMVNVAEEVRDASRTIGRAITVVVIFTTLIYTAVAFVAVRTVPVAELANSDAPMALIFARLSSFPPEAMSLVAMLAVVNGALIQTIMAARVAYGLADAGLLPRALARVNQFTRTPVLATVVVGALVMTAAFLLPLVTLAEITSALILIIFTLVNLSLILVKRRGPAPEGAWEVPVIVPILGAMTSVIFAIIALGEVFRT